MASREALKRQMLSNSLNMGGALGNYKSPIRQSFFGLTPEEQERVDYEQAQINNRMQAMAMTGSNRPTSLGRDLGFEVGEGFFKPFQKEFLPSKADKQAQENVDLQRELDQKLASMQDASAQDKLLEVGNFLIKKGRSADGLKILQAAGANNVKRSSAAVMAEELGYKQGDDDYNQFIEDYALKEAPKQKGIRGEVLRGDFTKSFERIRETSSQIPNLQVMYSLVNDEEYGKSTGFSRGITSKFSSFLGEIGVKDYAEQASFDQAFTSVRERLLADTLNAATGPQTDSDADRARQQLASLGNTPEANKFIVGLSLGLAQAETERFNFINDFLDKDVSRDRDKALQNAYKAYSKYEKEQPTAVDFYKPKGATVPTFYWEYARDLKEQNSNLTKQDIAKAWKLAKKESYVQKK